MAKPDNSGSGGPSFLSLLTMLFIGLKLTGFIDWPWWLVLAPIWGDLAIILVCFLVLGVIAFIESRRC